MSAADLYDIFGFPSDDTDGGEKVVIALTFASVPEAGVLRPRHALPAPDARRIARVVRPTADDHEPGSAAAAISRPEGQIPGQLQAAEIRVTVDA